MRVGDYVRTEYGIAKIIGSEAQDLIINLDKAIMYDHRDYISSCTHDEIIKSSPNIIDLIEVGDYVNGNKVYNIETSYIFDENHNRIGEKIRLDIGNDMYGYTIYIEEKDIKTIVTREQFSQMEYKIESEVN